MLRMLAPVAVLALVASPALASTQAKPATAKVKAAKHQHAKVTKTTTKKAS